LNNISDRLKRITQLVIPGESIADIGTDHGYVPIELLSRNIVPFAILSDVNDGPLEIAKENLVKDHISEEHFFLRKADGLQGLDYGEVSTVIIAGMGGELIESILDFDSDKSHSFKRLILQPRTRSNELRYYLSNNSFEFEDYVLVKEKFRICEIFVVKPAKDKILEVDTDLVSKFLLQKKDPLIAEFLDHKIKSINTILNNLNNTQTEEGQSQTEIFNAILNNLLDIRKGIK